MSLPAVTSCISQTGDLKVKSKEGKRIGIPRFFDTFTPKFSIMDYQKVYLLSVLIEYADSVTDVHKVFGTECLAKVHMQREIAEVSENFTGPGRRVIDMPTCVEWRDEDGYGYTVCVEELDVM